MSTAGFFMKKSQLNQIKSILRLSAVSVVASPIKEREIFNDKKLLKEAYAHVTPLLKQDTYQQHPRAIPKTRTKRISKELILSSPYDDIAWLQTDDDSKGAYQSGLRTNILKSMRRRNWVAQAQLDLHGMHIEQAENATLQFLQHAQEHGLQRLRIIHGKGLNSPNQEPILKKRICRLLTYQANVLAFTHPSSAQGGEGVLLILIKKRFDPDARWSAD